MLIEVILSLTVISLLFGASLKVYQYLQHQTSSASASEEISKIRKVFENYFTSYGYWPKGIFPIGEWFDLSCKKSDFKAVFSGRDENTNPEKINFIEQISLEEKTLEKPLWIFLCAVTSIADPSACPQLSKLRNRPTQWEQIDGLSHVFSYTPQPDENYCVLSSK